MDLYLYFDLQLYCDKILDIKMMVCNHKVLIYIIIYNDQLYYKLVNRYMFLV